MTAERFDYAVALPKNALTMTDAIIVEWMKHVGDDVDKGEVLFVMETDKDQSDVEAPVSGTLVAIHAEVGEVVTAGSTVAVISTTDRAAVAVGDEARTVAPAALELAEQLGIDIEGLVGSGTGGRIIEEDVIRAAQANRGKHE
jgi:pyruvate/2-oxoglutarate dehydrogenase complex dihydrolipoamide acyltransferase (E2) component